MALTTKFGVSDALITPDMFNTIKDIHDQGNLAGHIIQELGAILAKHNVADKYMLGLLHRPYTLPENALAVTVEVSPDVTITKITSLEKVKTSALRGQIYFITSDYQWQAYEYELGSEPVSFESDLLCELGAAIVSKGLQDKVSLASSTNASNTSEFQIAPNATVTISSPHLNLKEQDYYPRGVAWAFDEFALPGNYQYQTTTKNHTQLYFTKPAQPWETLILSTSTILRMSCVS